MNEPLIPSAVSRTPVSNDLFKTPILVLTQAERVDHLSDLSLTLETLLRQPGIEPRNVIVFYNQSCCPSVRLLVDLFGFMAIAYPTDPVDLLKDSIQTAQLLFPDAGQLILLESHIILSPDFLPFFGQMMPILTDRDSGVVAVAAWNENGLARVSTDARVVYRMDATSHAARFAVMIKRLPSFHSFDQRIRKSASWSFSDPQDMSCLYDGAVNGSSARHILVPDVSRVSVIVASLESGDEKRPEVGIDAFVQKYLSQARNVNTDDEVRIMNSKSLLNASSYESSIRDLMSSSRASHSLPDAVSLIDSWSSTAASGLPDDGRGNHQDDGLTG